MHHHKATKHHHQHQEEDKTQKQYIKITKTKYNILAKMTDVPSLRNSSQSVVGGIGTTTKPFKTILSARSNDNRPSGE